MWTTNATAHSAASASTIWELYRDVDGWPRWDHGITASHLDGTFAIGSSGTLQPMGGPEMPFTLTEVSPEQLFTDQTPINPETAIIFRHELTTDTNGTLITHTIQIVGPDAEHLVQALGPQLQHGVVEAVEELARLAEIEQKSGKVNAL